MSPDQGPEALFEGSKRNSGYQTVSKFDNLIVESSGSTRRIQRAQDRENPTSLSQEIVHRTVHDQGVQYRPSYVIRSNFLAQQHTINDIKDEDVSVMLNFKLNKNHELQEQFPQKKFLEQPPQILASKLIQHHNNRKKFHSHGQASLDSADGEQLQAASSDSLPSCTVPSRNQTTLPSTLSRATGSKNSE
ncbi:hypothetical protein M5K25_000220 [Dendrobium thyrsiflorum]|uniref:Uncharacterized protein n=1 Tax=Dendrobium thyrsiflorum TaxID=117978 RepID=A0ABD0VT26_DENTH